MHFPLDIPVGMGTNRNENIHRQLRSFVWNKLSVETAKALVTHLLRSQHEINKQNCPTNMEPRSSEDKIDYVHLENDDNEETKDSSNDSEHCEVVYVVFFILFQLWESSIKMILVI